MKTSKILSIILATVIFSMSIFAVPSTAETVAHSGFLDMKKLSKAEIVSLTRDVSLDDTDNFYVTQPSVIYPYSMGEVKAVVQQNALNRFNNYRRLAGLGSVTLNAEYTQYAQGAAVVNAANNVMTHYPTKPDDMPDNFFKICEYGDCHCNIADYMGYHPDIGPLCFSVDLWMDDSDRYNIAQLGHRRWMLNPTMGETGFGCATSTEQWIHTAVYAFDNSVRASDYDFISWPPSGYMVNDTEFFTTNYAWSISLNPAEYDIRNLKTADVELTDSNGNKWSFEGDGEDDGFFNVDLGGYGSNRNAIIFRPTGINKYEGVYTVEVKNLRTADGKSATLVYTVEFFASDDIKTQETTTAPVTTTDPPTTEPTTVPPTTTTEVPTTDEPTTVPPTTTTEPTTVPPTTTTEVPTTDETTTVPPTTEPTTIPPTTTEAPTTDETTTVPPTTEPSTVPPTTTTEVPATDETTTVPPTTEPSTVPSTTAPATSEKPSEIKPDYMKGDVIADKRITASDARAALRFAAKIDVPSAVQFRAADVNEDEKLNAMGARLILRVAAKLDTFEEPTSAENKTEDETTFSEPANDKVNETTTTEKTTEKETTAVTKEPLFSAEIVDITTQKQNTTASATTVETTTNTVTTEVTVTTQTVEPSLKPVITTTADPVTTTKVQPNDDDAVVVSKNTNEYHDLECAMLIYGNDEIFALSLEQAKKKGYTPCRNCLA